MEIALINFGILLLFIGLIGCFLPVLPGPPFALGGYLLLLFHQTAKLQMDSKTILWLSIGVIIVTVIDYVLPVWSTKKLGGTPAGTRGSMVGLILGIIFPIMGPFTLILAPLFGAIIGELLSGQNRDIAIKSGIGSFIGFLGATFLKLTMCGFIIFYFYRAFYPD